MDSVKEQLEIKATGQNSKIQIQQNFKKTQVNTKQESKEQSTNKKDILMKLYVYGSCQSDQFRHPTKLSQSKRPICLTNIENFDLNDDEDDDGQKQGQKKSNIYPNQLFKKSIYKIACGGLHSVVLTSDGQAYTFGCNDEGALGRKGPECIPVKVQLDHPVDLISAGDNHSMFANSANGIVYFTGNYNYLKGQKMVQSIYEPIKFTTTSLDIRNKNHSIQKIVSGANHTCILINNKIFCRGQPEAFTTGRRINQRRKTQSSLTFDGVGLNNVMDVWCGGYHTVAKVKKGKDFVYHTWGKNDQGQLGIGNFKSQAFPVQIKSLRGKNITKVAAGSFFTIFLTQNGQMLGCGTNEYGQVGLGQDYEFVPSQASSQQQQENSKEQQLNQHVENLQLSEGQKKVDHQSQVVASQMKNMQIQQPGKYNNIQEKNKIISQSNQKNIASNEIKNQNQPQSLNFRNNEQKSQKKKYQQHNMYIKSIRPIVISEQASPKSMITDISAGSQFVFAWNNITQLYSWGFGMNYVLLNGEQNQQYEPFKVRNKIINDQIINQIQAGGQHVLYTAFQKTQSNTKPNVALQQRVSALFGQKLKLSRKRKN